MTTEGAPIFQTWGDVFIFAAIGVFSECAAALAFYMLRWLLSR